MGAVSKVVDDMERLLRITWLLLYDVFLVYRDILYGILKMMLNDYEAYTCGMYSGGCIGEMILFDNLIEELFGVSAAVPFLVAFCLEWGSV